MSLLRARPATTPGMLATWSDAATLAHALGFEAALAEAEAAEGLIAGEHAEVIVRACESMAIDVVALADEAALAGTLAIPLVARLRAAVGGDAAAAVHLGATSQDLADTVLMAQARTARGLLLADLRRIAAALEPLARTHAALAATGRTLLQDAVPIGFGLRLAQWCAGIVEATRRLAAEPLPVQFGGAAGTRAGLGDRGDAVMRRVADALGLVPAPPWHARRGAVAGLAAALGIVIGACGKMARDVALLAQNAVGEAHEPRVAGRGGSSAMAHKRNPTGCQVALSAATRAPGLVAGVLGAMAAEGERGLGGWQAEAPILADLFMLAAGAADAMAAVAEGLAVDVARIAANLRAAGIGADIGESAMLVDALLAIGED